MLTWLATIGAVGVEIVSEIRCIFPDKPVVLIHSKPEILSAEPLPEEFKAGARELLEKSRVQVLLNRRVVKEEDDDDDDDNPEGGLPKKKKKITLSSGEVISTGKVLWSVARHTAQTYFLPPSALHEDGCIKVHQKYVLLPATPWK